MDFSHEFSEVTPELSDAVVFSFFQSICMNFDRTNFTVCIVFHIILKNRVFKAVFSTKPLLRVKLDTSFQDFQKFRVNIFKPRIEVWNRLVPR